jgi:hypothetical protein
MHDISIYAKVNVAFDLDSQWNLMLIIVSTFLSSRYLVT